MKKTVFLADLYDFSGVSRLNILAKLFHMTTLKELIQPGDFVAIKIHFGESGNLAYVHPQYIRQIVRYVNELGGRPFLTDTNTFNGDTRLNALDHIQTANQNGFLREVVEAPIVIADGLKGNTCKWVEGNGKHLKNFAIGAELLNADKVIFVSHFKGHQLGGFGGALKNLGVGSAARIGKADIHYRFEPKIDLSLCNQCKKCLGSCAFFAMEDSISIIKDKCVLCCKCMEICSQNAISLYESCEWSEIQERYIEFASAFMAIKGKETYFINLMENITPMCGCWGFSDSYMVGDIGFAASDDPVALDQACFDLVNDSPYITLPELKECKIGEDKFKKLYPLVDGQLQLKYAAELQIGVREYEIERVPQVKIREELIKKGR